MKKKRVYLFLDTSEYKLTLQSLIHLKNSLTRQGRCTDYIDEMVLKLISAPAAKQ